MNGTTYEDELPHILHQRGRWIVPIEVLEPWRNWPEEPTKLNFSVRQRLFGPMESHRGKKLGIIGRLLYDWLYTDDLYFARVDCELIAKGQ